MLLQPRQPLDERVDEGRSQAHAGPFLEFLEVEHQPNDREMGVQAGAKVDRPLPNVHAILTRCDLSCCASGCLRRQQPERRPRASGGRRRPVP